MATIKDVAKESGVSVTTVSVVLNNAPRPVNPETRQRVLATARRMNYHPNAIARGLVSRRTHSIGVQFSSVEPAIVTNYYASGVLSGMLLEGARQKQDIHLFTTGWENAAVSGPRIKAQRTDGVLVVAPLIGSDIASGLKAVGLPVVVVSAPSGIPEVPYVDVDNATGARLAVNHLLEMGHTRIAFMTAGGQQHSERERDAAYQATMRDAGLPTFSEYVMDGTFKFHEVAASLAQLMSLPEPPTAIFACNDTIALSLLKIARDMNVAIPEQLSIVGFDDAPLASLSVPALTTVRHPLSEVGRMAARLLMDVIERQPVTERYLFTPELIVRATTAPPQR